MNAPLPWRDPSGWSSRLDAALVGRHRSTGAWRNRTIADDARERAAATPDTVCLQLGEATLTFAEALVRAERLAAGLWELGLRPGDVLSFALPNWLEALSVDLAAALIGLVVNPIVPIYRDAEFGLILRHCRAKAIIIPATFRGFDYAAMVERLRPHLPYLRHVVVAKAPAALPGTIAFEALAESGGPVPWPRQVPEAIKMVMYTSGTTGMPKGVLHTHETMAHSMASCVDHWRLAEGDVVLMPSPVTHVTGFAWGLEQPFQHGLTSVLMERWNAEEAVGLIDRHAVAVTVGATPFLQELVDAADRAGSRLPSLKVFACGGAAVPPDLVARANALFARGRATRVYGSTEAPMITLGFVSPDSASLAAQTDGQIIDYEVRIVDERERDVAPGAEGEILARGPAMFVGYADPAETAAAFTADGFFRMGDIGLVGTDNSILITGRKKDLIIRGGENISAKEIEDALHRHPAVREAVAVSMPHARLGETVCAYVVPKDGHAPDLAELVRHLEAAGLAKQKFPEHLELVDDLPRTASGKVKKDMLRRMIADRIAATSTGSPLV
ncbi:AMP-binding protein [Phreatobacter cathodiphilus]|uniref:Cyclohexanecarboxylate-CoA ligase n=1 Tax=Phreatobacter cathodiphilus TaxID=1868589 RepID=A0A2S0NAD4_9HYPH|nr:AMP-binding protein [Phreatobacter cathodiphilus]AVO45130.1 cyclohexanecarboxylate-CoA ligase [Phreatobacter cathodiphilus]